MPSRCDREQAGGVTCTGYCFVNVPEVDDKIGEIMIDAYQSTASYIYAALK
jgi:hypothetical protein